MAESGKGGGERLSQVLIVLITAVVGPISVWYVTNPSSPLNTVRESPPALTATLAASPVATEVSPATVVSPVEATPSQAVTPTEAASASPTAEPTVEPTAIMTATFTPPPPTATLTSTPTRPSGEIPAGTPVVVDGLSLLISNDDISLDGEWVRLQIHVTNQSGSQQTLSFKPEAITLRDNTGKQYPILLGEGKEACKRTKISMTKTVKIEPGKEVIFQPLKEKELTVWCEDDQDSVLPFYAGPFPKDAKTLLVTFDGLGPFQGFSIVVKR